MKTTNFQIGQNFQHYNGYVWTITNISGKSISLESTNEGQTIKGSMTAKELSAIITANYYTPLF